VQEAYIDREAGLWREGIEGLAEGLENEESKKRSIGFHDGK